MVKVEFLGPINKQSIELSVSSLDELSAILKQDESLHEWLATSAIAVNDVLVSTKDTPLKSGDRVALLPPVCGG
ncbi:MAG: MoaD/ThiS family protein [Sulfurimonas sp.]|jgi:molybdopterin synthase sulfur carrier subunit|nr:MoaD/ThiS family protein [Sulfurimonadaceae bacterium]